MSVRENLTLANLKPFWRRGLFRHRAEKTLSNRLMSEYRIKPPDPERMMATLSGGNQQKVCVAKWLRDRPDALILDEPTAGIDIGGVSEVLELLRNAAQEGVGIVICSSDLTDLAAVCTRVLVVREGMIATELRGAAINRETIAEECYGSDTT
jgi:ribose transport system ATP-binding protein